jgi:tetratricopeptide (TPR) repeat protein
MRGPGETVDGNSILGEVPGDFGLLLWGTARDVALWGASPPGQRGKLFADGSGDGRLAGLVATEIPPAISASVDTIHGMLTLGARADASILCICCLEVAAWAQSGGLPETAITFAQAGAVAAPEFGEAALHTGLYALRAGQVARAGTWLRRAVSVSRRERNRPAYASALVELGALYEGGGSAEQAERFFRLGYRAGKRYASRSARMRATHGLFRLARARGDAASAAQFAIAAQSVYDPDAGGGPALLFDLARFWTDEGQPDRARSALRRLAPSRGLLAPAEQLAAAALAARAFAVPGGRPDDLATAAAAAAWGMMEDAGIAEGVRFAAALDLAHGARIACDLVAFTRAKRAVLTLAPQSTYPAVAAAVADLWPVGETPVQKMERAS